MSEAAKTARNAMRAKAKRLTSADPSEKVDSSSWSPAPLLEADKKTGARPLVKRLYKKGGKVVGKAEGKKAEFRADRKPRKSGGKAEHKAPWVDDLINRDVRMANDMREGVKHEGAFKKGGKAQKLGGGPIGMNPVGQQNEMMGKAAGMMKKGGRAHKAKGGTDLSYLPIEKKEAPKPFKPTGIEQDYNPNVSVDRYYTGPDYSEGAAQITEMLSRNPRQSPDYPMARKHGGKTDGHKVKWIQDAIKHPGSLHKALKVPEGKKIPMKKLHAAEEKGGKLAKKAHLAETLRGMHHASGGEVQKAMMKNVRKSMYPQGMYHPSEYGEHGEHMASEPGMNKLMGTKADIKTMTELMKRGGKQPDFLAFSKETKQKTGRKHGGKASHSDEAQDKELMHKILKPKAFKADGGPTKLTPLQELIKKAEDAGTRAGQQLAAQRRLQAQGKMDPRREAAMARGDMSGPDLNYFDKPFSRRADGGKAMHHEDCSCKKCMGGRMGKYSGGGVFDGNSKEKVPGVVPGGRMAHAAGGKTKGKTNVNIIIAAGKGQQPTGMMGGAPLPNASASPRIPQQQPPMPQGMPPQGMPPQGMPPQGGMPGAFKKGGRIAKAFGGNFAGGSQTMGGMPQMPRPIGGMSGYPQQGGMPQMPQMPRPIGGMSGYPQQGSMPQMPRPIGGMQPGAPFMGGSQMPQMGGSRPAMPQMPLPMGRKTGGRAYPIDTGSGGANARLEKIEAYGLETPRGRNSGGRLKEFYEQHDKMIRDYPQIAAARDMGTSQKTPNPHPPGTEEHAGWQRRYDNYTPPKYSPMPRTQKNTLDMMSDSERRAYYESR